MFFDLSFLCWKMSKKCVHFIIIFCLFEILAFLFAQSPYMWRSKVFDLIEIGLNRLLHPAKRCRFAFFLVVCENYVFYSCRLLHAALLLCVAFSLLCAGPNLDYNLNLGLTG